MKYSYGSLLLESRTRIESPDLDHLVRELQLKLQEVVDKHFSDTIVQVRLGFNIRNMEAADLSEFYELALLKQEDQDDDQEVEL